MRSRRLLGSQEGELLVVGTARCLWEDVNGLPEMRHVMAVNDIGMHWPGYIKWWYSNDVEQLAAWAGGRRRQYSRIWGGATLLSNAFRSNLSEVCHFPVPGQGGSGVAAIRVALAIGYTNIVVAGMPFDNSGHYYEPPISHNLRKDRAWSNFYEETPDGILQGLLSECAGRVRFLSGRGKELMG